MPRSLGDVHALLRYFGRERCILVGNDWGGYVAWVFASAYPDRVERLIILNAPHPAIFLREVRNSAAQIQASQYERGKNAAPAPYPPWYNYTRADPIKVPPSLAEAALMEMPDLAAAFFADVAEPPATTSLHVDVPTLVLWGMQDPACLPRSTGQPPRLCAECNRGSDRRCGPPPDAVSSDVGKSCHAGLPAAHASIK